MYMLVLHASPGVRGTSALPIDEDMFRFDIAHDAVTTASETPVELRTPIYHESLGLQDNLSTPNGSGST